MCDQLVKQLNDLGHKTEDLFDIERFLSFKIWPFASLPPPPPADVRFNYLKKTYTVTMGTYHMAILLLFNNADNLTFRELMETSQLPDKELVKQLQVLVESKILITEVSAFFFFFVLDIWIFLKSCLSWAIFTKKDKFCISTQDFIKMSVHEIDLKESWIAFNNFYSIILR